MLSLPATGGGGAADGDRAAERGANWVFPDPHETVNPASPSSTANTELINNSRSRMATSPLPTQAI
jgi:hypothetical protein